jgi:glycosyltransferase involved in cell wall biosynthesis
MSGVDIDVIHFVAADAALCRMEMLRVLLAGQNAVRHRVVRLGGGGFDMQGLGEITHITAPADVGWLARGAMRALLTRARQSVFHAWSPKALGWIAPHALAGGESGDVEARLLMDVELPIDLRRLAASYAESWSNGSIKFVCASDTALRRTIACGARADDCVLIRGSVDFGAANAARRSEIRKLMKIGTDDPVVLVLPPILRETGALTGAWAAMLLAQIVTDVCIVLPDVGRESARVRRLAESCGEAGRLRCPGRQFHVRELLAASDVALYLPPGEAPLGPAADAMASGRPIVASAVQATTEILVHGRNAWLCQPDDPKDAARRLLQALEQRDQSARQAASARSQAFETFGRRRMVEQYQRVYENVVSGAPLGADVAQ